MKNSNTAQQITIQEALLENRMVQWEYLRDKPEKSQRDLQQEGNLLTEICKINDKIDRLKRQETNENNPQVCVVFDHEKWCRDLIEDNGIMFTGKPTVYWLTNKKDGGGVPLNFPKDAMVTRHFRLTDRTVRECFEDMLERQGRKFDKVTYSFLPQPSNVLNLMSRDNWVQPVEGEPHELFDILLRSLGGGTEEGYEHLRQCLLWKYRYPEDFMLPCPVLYGVGGVGKNFFIDGVCRTLFGGQAASLGIPQVLGGFNGLMAGKAVVMINEAAGDRVDYERLKDITGAPQVSINEKYGAQYLADATAWYWLGCNDYSGAVRMTGNGVDRRWSPISVKKSLVQWVEELKVLSNFAAEQWLADNAWVARDPVEAGKWLQSLIDKGMPTYRPKPLRTKDYDAMVEVSQGPLEDLVAVVDDHRDVQYLLGDVVYRGYTQLYRTDNPSGKPMGIKKFYANLEAHVEQYWADEWELVRENVQTGLGSKTAPQKVLRRTGYAGPLRKRDMSRHVDSMGRVMMFLPSWDPMMHSNPVD